MEVDQIHLVAGKGIVLPEDSPAGVESYRNREV